MIKDSLCVFVILSFMLLSIRLIAWYGPCLPELFLPPLSCGHAVTYGCRVISCLDCSFALWVSLWLNPSARRQGRHVRQCVRHLRIWQ